MTRPERGYEVYGVLPGKVVKHRFLTAPSDMQLVAWGLKAGASFVVRYWPSKKGWAALDIRKARTFDVRLATGRAYPSATGHIRGTTVYPSIDAAVMHLMAVPHGEQYELL